MVIFLFIFIIHSFAESNIECNNAFCSECNSTKNCTKCITGYILKEGKCVYMREEHCNVVEEIYSKYCLECLNGYKLDFSTGKCVEGKETCSEVMTNIETKTISCAEYTCEDYEITTLEGCFDCRERNPFCLELTTESIEKKNCNKCKSCMDGTKLVNGKCEIIDKYCKYFDYMKPEICIKCHSGYFLNAKGKCEKGKIEDCMEYDSDGNCSICINGGIVKENKCVDECNVDNCKRCDISNPNKCQICSEGYTTQSNKCIQLSEHCLSGSISGNIIVCYRCEDGYYTNEQNECVQLTEHCLHAGSEGKCFECERGYFITTDGYCEEYPEHCLYIDENENCAKCEYNYLLSGNHTCIEKLEGCKKYTDDYEECIQCKNGYTLIDGMCETDGCETKDKKTKKCIKCLSGYYMKQDYTCGKCNTDLCYFNCINSATSCIDSVDNCFQLAETGVCERCYGEYEVVNGNCVWIEKDEIQTNYCVSQTVDGECTLCSKSSDTNEYYWPDSNGKCSNGIMKLSLLCIVTLLIILI